MSKGCAIRHVNEAVTCQRLCYVAVVTKVGVRFCDTGKVGRHQRLFLTHGINCSCAV